jgi:Ca-activated chloride channel family protein
MAGFYLEDPWWLLALAVLPLVLWRRRAQPVSTLVIPFAGAWYKPTLIQPSRMPAILVSAGLVVLVLALARPQRLETYSETRQEGHDLMLSIDLSGSMLAEDFELAGERINRLQAIKPVIQAFINDRPHDRIGLVVFAGKAYTLAPPTFDHEWLARQIERLKIGAMEDGTALGDGLGLALSRLVPSDKPDPAAPAAEAKDAKPAQKGFVILMTDGSSNKGLLTPMQAAEIAKARGITVYTIGAGKGGSAPFPIFDEMGKKMGYRRIPSDLDEKTLQEIAKATGGGYFRADNTTAVTTSFKAIDASQRTKFDSKVQRPRDFFLWFIGASAVLILWGALLARPPLQQEVTA